MSLPRIAVVYRGVFQYDALNAFAEALAAGFDALGLQTVLLDTKNDVQGSRTRLGELLTRPERIAFILGPGGILADATVGGQNLHDRFNVPYVALLVDHPSYLLMRLAKARNALITCVDRSHVRFLKAIGFPRAAYVPHAASLPESLKPWEERSPAIAFAASSNDDRALLAHVLADLAPPQRAILADLAADPALATLDQAEAAARAHPAAEKLGWGEGYDASLILFLNEVDRVLRSIRRNRIVSGLDAAGIPVDLFGRGWDRFAFRHHRVHPSLPFAELCEELQGYRMALHLNPLFGHGLHERICAATVAGCAVVTDGNPEIAAVYPDGEAAIHFSPAAPGWAEALAGRLQRTDLAAVAQAGRRITARGHTWTHRAAEILALVDATWPDRVP